MNGALQNLKTGEIIGLGENFVIGRRIDCELVLHDAKISRKHAMIRWQGIGYWLYDLGSSNGCYLNDRRVQSPQSLSDSHVIRLGPFEFRFVSGEATGFGRDGGGQTDMQPTLADVRTIPVMMLVADIRGFTELSEQISPDALAKSMGLWYRECIRVLEAQGSTIDKFIGDCVLAYWQETHSGARDKAIRAAHSLVEATHELQLEIGIGLHVGSVAHGAMSQGAFTLLGDAVNATFRLESLTRKLERGIVVSGEFANGWDESATYCHPEGSHEVKGRQTPLEVFSVES